MAKQSKALIEAAAEDAAALALQELFDVVPELNNRSRVIFLRAFFRALRKWVMEAENTSLCSGGVCRCGFCEPSKRAVIEALITPSKGA